MSEKDNYAMDDIFEGLADLLREHGKIEKVYQETNLKEDGTKQKFVWWDILYHDYYYHLIYVDNEIWEIRRLPK